MKNNKLLLRKQFNIKRKNSHKFDAIDAIKTLIINTDSRSIAIYHAINHEINITNISSFCCQNNINAYHPIAYRNSKTMKFELFTGQKHQVFYDETYILDNEIIPEEIDLVFLPLLVADLNGNRIGYGGGYYDATFAKHKILCGIGYHWQLVHKIIPEKHDIRLNYMITDKDIIAFDKKSNEDLWENMR